VTESDPNRASDTAARDPAGAGASTPASNASSTPASSGPTPPADSSGPAQSAAARGASGREPAGLADERGAGRGSGAGRAGVVLAVIGIVLALAVGFWSMQRFDRIESEVARRLQSSEQRDAGFEGRLTQSLDLLRDLQSRSAVLESKIAETSALQAQIEKLYRDRAEDSFEVMLAELDASLSLAAQQLALGINSQAVLAVLQDLDSRIERQNDPRLLTIRAAILRDIERLRVYPATDVGSLALRIDALVSALDHLPLLATIRERVETANGVVDADRSAGPSDARPDGAPAATGESAVTPPFSLGRLVATFGAFGAELRDLFRVRRVDSPDALLVAPAQAYFLRQNLRLMLLNARLALLSRNDSAYRGDLERARRWIGTYFDTEHRNVMAVQAQLGQLLEAKIVLDPPRIDDSVAAVRLARASSR
jgi:uroporphyrin-3 C-methyltransferase/uroporphyrinogen III methyltransferase/synthase